MTDLGDAADRLLVEEMSRHLAQLRFAQVRSTKLAIIDDISGELSALAVLTLDVSNLRVDSIRVSCDSLLAQRRVTDKIRNLALQDRFQIDEDPRDALHEATLILLRLPKSLAALEELAEIIACSASSTAQLLAGNRVIHMSKAMNSILSQHFLTVNASLGRQRSRVLRASQLIRSTASSYPRSEWHEDLGLQVWAHGAVFSGHHVDLGTRALIECLDDLPDRPYRAIDLGCGSGILATAIAKAHPGAQILAVDESRVACLSAQLTVEANQMADRVTVRRTDRLTDRDDASADLIVCNPPFHIGTRKDSTPAFEMFADAGRVLVRGGELWTVFNSHLPYRQALRRLIGRTEIVRQDPKFTVARAKKA